MKLIQRLKKRKAKNFPHECFYCRFFVMREDPPNIRVCRYLGNIDVKNKVCQMWDLEPDPKKRKRSFI